MVCCGKVLADVTGGADLLARAIAGSDAVIVATGFRPSFDLTASWKVLLTYQLSEQSDGILMAF